MAQINIIDPLTLKQWLQNEQTLLIDVREPIEYKQEHIKGAINIPLSQITIDILSLKNFKDKKVVMQCKAGIRSMLACEKLQQAGVDFEIWNLEGGILAWRNNKLPVT